MPSFALDALLLAPHAVGAASLSSRPIEAQANFLDGWCILSFYASHALFDAFGLCLIIEAWAANVGYCRVFQGVQTASTPQDSISSVAKSSASEKRNVTRNLAHDKIFGMCYVST